MQRATLVSSNMQKGSMLVVREPAHEKETIHSGQFMVSHFEADAQDDEDDLAVPVPEVAEIKNEFVELVQRKPADDGRLERSTNTCRKLIVRTPIGIDTSLAKLFQCMSLAYRQKLTSPKWNRFRGIRLRWKDKIRLNNVIWRCWHMQFIKKQNTLICQFASPLDVDTHNKPEAVVLEGKYWKRKLAAVTAEYKKWRMFYRNQVMGHNKDAADALELELLQWNSQTMDENMLVDEDYMGLMSDTLFSTITNQPFAFPDTREIAKAGLADFIQPSLGPLQPNLDDYMDTFEPLQEFMKLAPVPEEQGAENTYKNDFWYTDYMHTPPNLAVNSMPVQPPVNLPIEPYPMQITPQQQQHSESPLSIKPPQSQMPPPKYIQSTSSLIYNEPDMYNPMISKAQQPMQKNAMELTPSKSFAKPMYMSQPVNIASNLCTNNQQIQDTQDISYKINSQPAQSSRIASTPPSERYKFTQPALPNIKFTSQQPSASFTSVVIDNKKDEKPAVKPRNVTRGRPRSRSNTRETIKKPPLLSAVSDPSLITTSNSALLTQLLRNNEASTSTNQRAIMPLERNSYVRVKEESVPIQILPQPTPTTLIITPVNMTPIRPAVNYEPVMLNAPNNSPGIPDNTSSINSPTPSQDSLGSPTRESNRDHRRAGHIHAEQKRRYNIKNGFDMIHSLIPQLNKNPNAKLSKAAMLQKGAEYIRQLRTERNTLKDEIDSLKTQIETLNASISNCQSLLPATGAPVSRRTDNKLQEMFDEYVQSRTREDWKYSIFSLLFQPLLTSFTNVVSARSIDDLYRSTMLWVEQHCTLADLRPIVLNSLRYVCTQTDILSNPEKLPDEAREIIKTRRNHPSPP